MILTYILALTVYHILAGVKGVHEPITSVNQGTAIGKYMKSRDGKQFSAYLSIPYAEPPVGKLRFRAPIPAKAWNGNLNATIPHAICPQINPSFEDSDVNGDENCLFLNIYTPKINKSDLKLHPVMIFIHGGGFFAGNAQLYEPDYLLDEDIVLVTINYRLGPLGFLSTGDEFIPGNNGLKDQALAIKWVYRNIEAFGGNPEEITIFGESAGAASVHLHMFSPQSQGYIKRAISQSGTATDDWGLQDKTVVKKYTEQIAQYLGCSIDNHTIMIECLRSTDANKIVKSERVFVEWDFQPLLLFTPVIEAGTQDAFLAEHPLNIVKSKKYPSIPWMTGVNSEEGLFKAAEIYKNPKLIEELDKNFNQIIAKLLLYKNHKNKVSDETANKIREFYFGDKKIDHNTMYNVVNLYTDLMFVPAANFAVTLHLKHSKQPVYYYLYSHKTKNSFGELFGLPNLRYGTSHADELLLQFPLSIHFGNATLDDLDMYYSKLIIKLWTNFAKTSNPTPESDSMISTKWKAVETENLEYYHIGGGVHTASNLYPERIKFWKELEKSIVQEKL